MNTDNLRTFLLLVKLKNFTRVAEHLFIAQSTVTNRIAELEREMDVRLLRRDTRNVALTEDGKTFYEYARRIVEMEDACISAVRGGMRQIRVGTTNAIYEGVLKDKILEGISQGRAFRVTIGHTAEILEMLWDGLLDAAYVYQDVRRAGFVCTPYSRDELVFLARSDKNEFPQGIRQEQLAQIPCAMCNFSLQEIGSYLRELFPAGHVFSFEVDNSSKVKDYLKAGLGYAFLPRGIVKEELASGLFAEIAPIDFMRMDIPSYCVCRREDGGACFLPEEGACARLDM